MWLDAGNRYLQCDSVGEAGIFNEDGGLAFRCRVGGAVYNFLKEGWIERKGGETKILKREGMLGKALEKGGCDPLTNYICVLDFSRPSQVAHTIGLVHTSTYGKEIRHTVDHSSDL